MSIIAAAAAATHPVSENIGREVVILSVAVLPGLLVLWLTRAYRLRSVAGPPRVPAADPLWPVPVALFASLAGLFVTLILVGNVLSGLGQSTPAATPAAATQAVGAGPTVWESVVVSATTPLGALVAGVGFLLVVRPSAVGHLGMSRRVLPAGLLAALAAAAFAVPATFLVSAVTELTYRAVGYQHPTEHDLLRWMKEAGSPLLKVTAIAAAVLVAPLVEEFLFRGLLQTSLVTWFVRLGRRPADVGFSVLPLADPGHAAARADGQTVGPVVTADPYVSPPPHPAAEPAEPSPVSCWSPPAPPHAALGGDDPPGPRWVEAWLAIVITSGVFAIIHPLWTAPIIFFLSLAIGYVYERTGNLWAAVGLHALFNASSTALFLLYPTAN